MSTWFSFITAPDKHYRFEFDPDGYRFRMQYLTGGGEPSGWYDWAGSETDDQYFSADYLAWLPEL